MKNMVVLLILIIMLCSCSTSQVVQTREVHDTVRMVAVQHDSVLVRDSVYIREYRQNDTVYVTQWKERWRERVVIQRDTVIHNVDADANANANVDANVDDDVNRIPKIYRISLAIVIAIAIAIVFVIVWRVFRWKKRIMLGQ